MILVDSSVWVDYFNGRRTRKTDRLDALLGSELLLTGDLILAEVLQGFRRERDFRRALGLFDALVFRPIGGRELAISSARNHRALRARGVTVRKTIDTIIATYCIAEGHQLLHCDRHFDPFERHLGLQVVKV